MVRLTETLLGVAAAPPARPRAVAVRAMREGAVLVPDVVEEVELVFALEEPRCDAVHGRVAPALWAKTGLGERKRERG